jgi:mono/diheme cytochrome c family protein
MMIALKKRYAALVVAALFLLGLAALSAVRREKQSSVASKRMMFEVTPARLERGRYLVEHVGHCFACHSAASWETEGLPVQGRRGAGQLALPDDLLPIKIVVPNITPDAETGSGRWDDAQFAHAIREGVGHDGRRLVPIMPYLTFRVLSDEDVASIVVYLRSIPAVRNPLPKRDVRWEQYLPPLMPPLGLVPPPDLSNPVKRGEYLVNIGNCTGCHTPIEEKLNPLPGLDFAGGQILKGPWGEVASANLTPDPSGISYYDQAMFLRTIRTGHVGARKLNQIMLWRYFRGMRDEDLKAIFAYLRTLKPVKHRVDNTEPPTYCKLCLVKHGAGNLN